MSSLTMYIHERSREIPVTIGRSLWTSLAGFLAESFPAYTLFVIADSNVEKIYGRAVETALGTHRGFRGAVTFPAGEGSKSREWKSRLEDLLLERRAGRDAVLIAMGGGVTGDLAGFVAATLNRGVPLVHLATSLLAQVDSAIGGKVGIDHRAGKNLIGAFYQPEAIFIDTELLETLPEEEFLNGLGEVVKYAVTLDDELWGGLERDAPEVRGRSSDTLERVVRRCAELKAGVVERDEREDGYRSILNFGHTVGHAVERLSGYRVKHGFAVAAGMIAALRLSHELLGYPAERVGRLQALIGGYGLDRVDLGEYPVSKVWEAIAADKKSRGGEPRFTLMRAPGQPSLFHPVSREELASVLSKS